MTAELLARYSEMIARDPDDLWAFIFLSQHRSNSEFVELARVARALKLAFMWDNRRPGRPPVTQW